ncbi:MAG: DUF4173 domain-containing protein [Nitriliruptor sp.]|uniref:DUF4153 domain-containing protein n=1 Tax=Nitriliruptor sp. TaxID=2448056 RepID=UPI0034A0932D
MSADTPSTSTQPPPPPGPPTGAPPPLERPELTPSQLALALTAGLIAALLLPYREVGIALVLSGFAVAAAVVASRRGDDAGAFGGDPWRWTFAANALALSVLPTVTDAAWVLALTAPASAGLGLLAVGGGRTWLGTVAPVLRTVLVTFTGLGAASRAIQRAVPSGARWGRHVRTGLVTTALLLVFGGLFRSADAAFAGLLDAVIPELSLDSLLLRVVIGGIFASGSLTLLLSRSRPDDDLTRVPTSSLAGSEWIVPLATLVGLFAAFVLVQAGTLFGGDALVQRTSGLTYAAYAREGFGQLLTVAILTLGVVAVASRYAAPRDERDARLRRGLLAALCGLTLVVLVSAFQRLSLYEAAFGFTRDRVTAHATIVWIGVLFVLVVVLGAWRRSEHLPRAAVAWTGLALLIFGMVQPDAIVARLNVERFEATGELDVWLLSTLSADAAPAIAELPAEVRACVSHRGWSYGGSPERLALPDDPLEWNRSRAVARQLPAAPDVPCQEPAGGSSP